MALENTTKSRTYLPYSTASATVPAEPVSVSVVMDKSIAGYQFGMIDRPQRPYGKSTGRMDAAEMAEYRLEKLIRRLPDWAARAVRYLRRPESRWMRLPIAFILIPAGLMWFLPVLGFWMLPLGLLMVAVDIPILRRQVHRLVNWLAGRRPHWFR